MAGNVEGQIKQLEEEMKKAKTQGEKDMITARLAELKRQLAGSKKK
jgi:ribosome-interacting GTPase 1